MKYFRKKWILAFVIIAGVFLFNFIFAKTTGENVIKKVSNYISNEILNKHEYNKQVKETSSESAGYASKEPGSWHMKKSAEWEGINTVKVKLELDTIEKLRYNPKDVIFVVENSYRTRDERLDKIKSAIKDLVNYILDEDGSKVALITFNTSATIQSDFSSDKDSLNTAIDAFESTHLGANYSNALSKVDTILSKYTKEDNKDVLVVLLGDGYTVSEYNGIAEYKLLKDKYSYLKIHSVSSDLGYKVTRKMGLISDVHNSASIDMLDNALFETTLNPLMYEKFEIVEYINNEYFTVKSAKSSDGDVKIEQEDGYQKVIVTLQKNEKRGYHPYSGLHNKINLELTLNDKYIKEEGYYPILDGEEITYILDDGTKSSKNTETPVLRRNVMNVTYDSNTPEGCNIDNRTEKYAQYETVTLPSEELSCDGYLFKGWEVATTVDKINDTSFIMPSTDVTIRAIWSKLSVIKSMDGTVGNRTTLYNAVKEAARTEKNAKQYTGEVTDTPDGSGNKNVYYYTGREPSNNVIFGGYCWQIIRTTSTGGVKMIYNGVPNDAGQCNNTGSSSLLPIGNVKYNETHNTEVASYLESLAHLGYMYNKVYEPLYGAVSVPFGNSVSYDKETKKYTLINTTNSWGISNHYACDTWNSGNITECEKVRYYYTATEYIRLEGGATVETALKEMLSADDVNKNDSTIKTKIDKWYKENMTNYTKYLEDAVFCNDRTLFDQSFPATGWNPNGGGGLTDLYFNTRLRVQMKQPSLKCENITDRFSTANEKAQLTYPIGLLSIDELSLSRIDDDSSYLHVDANYWTGSPDYYKAGIANMYVTYGSWWYTEKYVGETQGVRPVISLKPGTVYSEGFGTKDLPYMVETE